MQLANEAETPIRLDEGTTPDLAEAERADPESGGVSALRSVIALVRDQKDDPMRLAEAGAGWTPTPRSPRPRCPMPIRVASTSKRPWNMPSARWSWRLKMRSLEATKTAET